MLGKELSPERKKQPKQKSEMRAWSALCPGVQTRVSPCLRKLVLAHALEVSDHGLMISLGYETLHHAGTHGGQRCVVDP